MARRRQQGMSLVEVAVVVAIVGVIASMALPTYQSQLAKAQRAEAIEALTRLQLAQEAFRAQHGSYALALRGLSGVSASSPHFQLALVDAHASGYIVRARALEATRSSGGCDELTLSVADGQAVYGPADHCWNR